MPRMYLSAGILQQLRATNHIDIAVGKDALCDQLGKILKEYLLKAADKPKEEEEAPSSEPPTGAEPPPPPQAQRMMVEVGQQPNQRRR